MYNQHRTIRLNDEQWDALAQVFKDVVPDENRPARTKPDTNWQITEGLRMIARGDLTLDRAKRKYVKRDNQPAA